MYKKTGSNATTVSLLFERVLSAVCSAISFAIENARPRYSLKIVGQKFDRRSNTVIFLYGASLKKETFKATAKELCASAEIIAKFSPHDIQLISYIAGIEDATDISRVNEVDNLKKAMLNAHYPSV